MVRSYGEKKYHGADKAPAALIFRGGRWFYHYGLVRAPVSREQADKQTTDEPSKAVFDAAVVT